MNAITPIRAERTERQHIYSILRELQVRGGWLAESACILNSTPHFPVCDQLRQDRTERLDDAIVSLEKAIAEYRRHA